ncbi:MAG: PH domain-containing protein [Candidatus Nomurabacteria bacterium]|jgi:hypothetical protein|nr:PH domain-containing protein [Candidatus Nomurabacteria bacterium]
MEQAFSGQRVGEKVLAVFRRHVITMRKGFLVWYCLLAIAVVIFIFPLPSVKGWIGSGLLVFGSLYFFYHWLLWYFSVSVVTNERIRQISQKGFFKKSVVDISLDKVHSLSYTVPGFMAGLYHYGTIIIQTEVGDLTLTYISHPDKIYDEIQGAMDKAPKKASDNEN